MIYLTPIKVREPFHHLTDGVPLVRRGFAGQGRCVGLSCAGDVGRSTAAARRPWRKKLQLFPTAG